MDNKYKKLLSNSFWTLAGNTGSKILSFLLLPLYTRWLGTAGFGESDLVTTYSSFLVCVMTFCVSDAIFVYTKNQTNEIKKSYFTTSLVFILIILGLWLLVWGIMDIAFSVFNVQNSFSNNLWYIYGIVLTTFLQQYAQQFILSLEKIKIYSLTGLIHTAMTFVMSFMLIPKMGVRGYILSMIFSNLITAAYSFLFSHSYNYLSISAIEKQKIKEVLKYSIPLIPNGIMWWLVSALNRPVMEYHLDYSSIGLFAVANRFPAVITMVFSVFSVAWNISVFEEYDKEGFDKFYVKTFKMLFSLITLLASIVIVSSELIIRIFAAPEFSDASKYMPLLIVGALFSCYSAYFGTCFSVVKQSKYFFYSSLWGAFSAIVLNFILIPMWGIWGTCISTLLSFIIMYISRYIYSLKYVKSNLLPISILYGLVLICEALLTLLTDTIWIRIISLVIPITLLFLGGGKYFALKVKAVLDKKI